MVPDKRDVFSHDTDSQGERIRPEGEHTQSSDDASDARPNGGEPSDQSAPDSAWAWLFRGVMVGAMVLGSANALSFFFRSRGWGSLLGDREVGDEAIGFPLMVWQEESGYSTHALRMGPFLFDIGTAILAGVVLGLLAIRSRGTLNQIMDRFRGRPGEHDVRLQFSLRGLLITTVLAALAAAIARVFAPRVEVLAAIYAFGPLGLIVFAYLPSKLSWQQRVAILTPSTLVLIAVAIALGHALSIEFDKVLMGIFICWTPQAAIGAVTLTTWLFIREYRELRRAV